MYTILKGKYKFCKQENIDFGINIPQKTHANIGIGKASRVLTVFEIMGAPSLTHIHTAVTAAVFI